MWSVRLPGVWGPWQAFWMLSTQIAHFLIFPARQLCLPYLTASCEIKTWGGNQSKGLNSTPGSAQTRQERSNLGPLTGPEEGASHRLMGPGP